MSYLPRRARTTQLRASASPLRDNGGWRISPVQLLDNVLVAGHWWERTQWPCPLIYAGAVMCRGESAVLLGRFADRAARVYACGSN